MSVDIDLSDLTEDQLTALEQGDASSLSEAQLSRIEDGLSGHQSFPPRPRESGLRAFGSGLVDEALFGVPELVSGGKFVPTHKTFGAQVAEGTGRTIGFLGGGPARLGAKVASKVAPRLGRRLFGRMATGAVGAAASIAPTALTSPDELPSRAMTIPFGMAAGALQPVASAAKKALPFIGKARGQANFTKQLEKIGASKIPVEFKPGSFSVGVGEKQNPAYQVINDFARGYADQFGKVNPLDKIRGGQTLNVQDAVDLRNILDLSARSLGKEAGSFLAPRGASGKRAAAFRIEGIRSKIVESIKKVSPETTELLGNYGRGKKVDRAAKSFKDLVTGAGLRKIIRTGL